MNRIATLVCIASLACAGQLSAQAPTTETYGKGCPGSFGTPAFQTVNGSLPEIDTLYVTEVAPLPPGDTIVCVMMSCHRLNVPVDLGGIGMNGCELWITPEAFFGFTARDRFELYLKIPKNPIYLGLGLQMQAVVVDTQPVGPMPITLTPGFQSVIGQSQPVN